MSNQVRLLGVLTERRLADLPDLPTAKEQGVDLVVTKFRGLAGPKNIPPATLKALEDGIEAVLADPAYQKEYARENLIPAFMRHEEAARFTAKIRGRRRGIAARARRHQMTRETVRAISSCGAFGIALAGVYYLAGPSAAGQPAVGRGRRGRRAQGAGGRPRLAVGAADRARRRRARAGARRGREDPCADASARAGRGRAGRRLRCGRAVDRLSGRDRAADRA